MKILIKESDAKKGFRLIVPYHILVNLVVRKTWFRMGLKHRHSEDNHNSSKEEELLRYLEAVDFEELREALHGLSVKSGLVLVEVQSSDGAHIKIET